ncbi:unnamed protein product, partial [Prorocentrum cordatum]
TSPGACAHGCPNPLKPSGDHDGPPRATQRARACGPALPAGSSGERLEAPSAGHRRAAQSGGAQRSRSAAARAQGKRPGRCRRRRGPRAPRRCPARRALPGGGPRHQGEGEARTRRRRRRRRAFTRKLTRATCAPASAQSAPFSSVALVAAWRLHTAHRTAPIDDRLCWEDFGCASHLQGTRESRNRWARPPSAGRRAASRRVEKAITKNPAPSAATTKSARSTCLCTVGNSQLQHTCAPQGAGIVSNPTAPGAMLPQRRAQRC